MPLVVLRFSLREVDTNASHTEPARESKRELFVKREKKDLENFFRVDTNMLLFPSVCLPM